MRMSRRDPAFGRRGFTLIELIITLGITAMVGVLLAGFLAPQIRVYHAANNMDSAKTVCAGVMNKVQDLIHDGKDFSVSTSDIGDTLSFTQVTEDGANVVHSAQNGNPLDGSGLGETLYPNCAQDGEDVAIYFTVGAKQTVSVTVKVTDTGTKETLYALTQSVLCPNMTVTG